MEGAKCGGGGEMNGSEGADWEGMCGLVASSVLGEGEMDFGDWCKWMGSEEEAGMDRCRSRTSSRRIGEASVTVSCGGSGSKINLGWVGVF